MTNYTISVEDIEDPENYSVIETKYPTHESRARELAKQLAEKYKDSNYRLTVEFFRESDGYTGYINPDETDDGEYAENWL
nr:hypothetical protein [Bacilli bacterium]